MQRCNGATGTYPLHPSTSVRTVLWFGAKRCSGATYLESFYLCTMCWAVLATWIYTVLRTSRTASFGSIRTWKRSCSKPPNPPWQPSSVANFSCTCHFVSVRKSNDVSWYHKHKCFLISCEDRPRDRHLIMENDIESHTQFTQFQIWSFLYHPTRVTSHLPQWVHPDWCLEWGLAIPKWAWCKPVGQGSIKNIWRKLQTQDGPFNVNRMYI